MAIRKVIIHAFGRIIVCDECHTSGPSFVGDDEDDVISSATDDGWAVDEYDDGTGKRVDLCPGCLKKKENE